MPVIINALLVGAAGAIGTLLRAGCTTLATKLLGPGFPWGTIFVNVAGSFAFGAVFALARTRAIPAEQEAALLVGLLGGFTTYSSFAFQSAELLSGGRPAQALAYMVATNALGLVAVWAGLRVGQG
ncbi:MAG: CrcB family protein [Planctomycetota bacterium]|nr:CrcB family protein [Planctomycetota bacterium]